LLIGMAMFTAGWAKLTTGWLQPSQRSTYGHLVGFDTWAAKMLLGVQSGWFWKPLDWLVILMESGFLMAAFYRPAFRVVCASACLFHVAVWLLFDMRFHGNVIAYGGRRFLGATSLTQGEDSVGHRLGNPRTRTRMGPVTGRILPGVGCRPCVRQAAWRTPPPAGPRRSAPAGNTRRLWLPAETASTPATADRKGQSDSLYAG
jgi:hypothetical protein